MSAKVRAIKEPEFKEIPVPDQVPLGVTMQFSLGAGKSMEFQVVLQGNDDLGSWNASLDKMRAAGERQGHIVELLSAKANLRQQDRELETMVHRLEIAEQEHQDAAVARDERIQKANTAIGQAQEVDQAAFAAKDRRGDYVESTNFKQRANRLRADIKHEIDEQAKADDEREQVLKGHRDAKNSIDTQSRWYESEIARLTALIEG